MMNVKKVFFRSVLITVMAVSVIFCLSSCGGKKEWVMNAQDMAESILNSVDFDAEMKQVKRDGISTFIEMPENYSGYMFMGDGSHSDCFGVFTFDSEDDSEAAEKSVERYLDELEDSFKRYIPEEADKVSSHAYVIRRGKNLVFVVSGDEARAEEVVDSCLVESDVSDDSNSDTDKAAEESKSGNTDTAEGDGTDGEKTAEEEALTPAKSKGFDLNDYPRIDTDKKLKYSGYIALIGNSAYELYDYVEGTADKYAKLVNYTGKKLGKDTNVYDMIVPLSSGVTVPNKYFKKIKGSDQRKSLNKIYKKLNKSVKKVNIYDNLMQHRDEKIYFRTDHHWTSLGAYYGYEKWCEESGILPIALDKREKLKMGNFVGTFYNDTKVEALRKNPDKLVAYLPKGGAYISKKNSSGETVKESVIYDYSQWADFIKYNAFLGGDTGLVKIINKDVKDDSVLVVVKESFGNCIAPYFTDHYHKVYVIDYRYYEGNIISFAKDKKADDLIFINNIGMTRSSYLVGKLQEALYR